MAPNIDLNALWNYVTAQVKGQITLPSLWRSMEAAKPLAVDGDILVLGYPAAEAHQMGLLLDNRHRNVIEQCLEQATRVRLKIHPLAAETVAEWEAHKTAQAEGVRLQQQAREQFQQRAEAGQTWDAVGEQLVRRFSALQNRGLASVQGRYLEDSLDVLAEAFGRLMPADADENTERGYSRVLDRIAERVNVPAALIAQMVLARRK
jgi:hypothetical protein